MNQKKVLKTKQGKGTKIIVHLEVLHRKKKKQHQKKVGFSYIQLSLKIYLLKTVKITSTGKRSHSDEPKSGKKRGRRSNKAKEVVIPVNILKSIHQFHLSIICFQFNPSFLSIH